MISPRLAGALVVGATSFAWLIPFDALALTGPVRLALLAALAGFPMLFALSLRVPGPRGVACTVLGVLLAASSVALLRDQPVTGWVLTSAFVLGGVAAGRLVRLQPRALLVVPALMGLVILGQLALRQNFYEGLFSSTYLWTTGEGFRTRGTLGHPLPTSALITTLGLSLAIVWWRLRGPQRGSVIVLALTVVLVLATGSRSALLVIALVLAAVLLARRAETIAASMARVALRAGYACALIGAALTFALANLPTLELPLPRALSFQQLAGTASLDNRSAGFTIVSQLMGQGCDAACLTFGHGLRSLEEQLRLSRELGGFTTVDNVYLTGLYDLGLVGLAALLALVILALRRLVSREADPATLTAAAALLALMSFGLVFDVIYWLSTLFALGLCLGILERPSRVAAPVPDPAVERAGSR